MQRIGTHAHGDKAAVARALPQVTLEITRGRALRKSRPVPHAAFLIGTAADCDLVLGDAQIAEVHSYLWVSPERVTVRHLGSGPALSIGGQNVSWAVLHSGDRLRIGPFEFSVQIQWPEGARAESSAEGEHQLRLQQASRPQRAAERLLHDVRAWASAWPHLSLYMEEQPDAPPTVPKRVPVPRVNVSRYLEGGL